MSFPLELVEISAVDGLEIGCQSTRQPHQIHIALGFPLQAARRLNAVEIAVDLNL
jgi:hypothetical protein